MQALGESYFLEVLKGVFKLKFFCLHKNYVKKGHLQELKWFMRVMYLIHMLRMNFQGKSYIPTRSECQGPKQQALGALSVTGFPNPMGALLSPTIALFEVNLVGSGQGSF